MGENQNWNQLGEQIKGAVNDAILSGNYSNLNRLVKDTVNMAVDEAKYQTKNAIDGINKEISKEINKEINKKSVHVDTHYKEQNGYREYNTGKIKNKTYNDTIVQPKYNAGKNEVVNVKAKNEIRVNKVGKVPGVLFVVFGSIGLGITCLVALTRLIWALFGMNVGVGTFIVFGVFILGFSYMIGHGCSLQARVKRAMRYAGICGQKMYADISELASHIGKKKKFVVKDIRKMLESGFFPEGHLDEQGTSLILSNDVYKNYVDAEKSRKVREEQEKAAKLVENNPVREENSVKEQPESISELDALILDGNEYIRKIRNQNDMIAGEVISNKLYRLENLLKEIFAQVKAHPEKMEQMRRFMEYYLPTTLKLVEAYSEFDKVSEPGEDILQAKEQIENTLDTINDAFSELLNNLFQDRVFDVTTDAQVLQTMLSRDGLVKDEI